MCTEKKSSRKRNRTLSIRMSDEEYEAFIMRMDGTSLSKQQFVIDSVLTSTITTDEKIEALRGVISELGVHSAQLRGIGTNLNQIAKIANQTGKFYEADKLEKLAKEIADEKKKCDESYKEVKKLIGGRIK